MNNCTFFVGCILLIGAKALPANDETFVCTQEGRFEDQSDCGKYFECLSDEQGNLIPKSRSCYGRAYSPDKEVCVKQTEVKGCHIRQSRHYGVSERFSNICKDDDVNFACGDCDTQITCIAGKAYETKCTSGFRCSTEADLFSGGVCHLQHEEKCRCGEANSYRQDPYYNGTFFVCENEDSDPVDYNCPKYMYFNETAKTCLNQDGTPSCSGGGIFAFPNDCTRYYLCTNALEGWVQTKFTCPEDQLFNEETRECEDPCQWSIKEFECEVEGRFSNPKDCRQFYECIPDAQGKFYTMGRTCPPNYHWNDESKRCISEFKSECRVKSEGPIKQCLNDYQQICEKDDSAANVPQIEESPVVPAVPVEGEGDDNVTNIIDEPQIGTEATPETEDDNEILETAASNQEIRPIPVPLPAEIPVEVQTQPR